MPYWAARGNYDVEVVHDQYGTLILPNAIVLDPITVTLGYVGPANIVAGANNRHFEIHSSNGGYNGSNFAYADVTHLRFVNVNDPNVFFESFGPFQIFYSTLICRIDVPSNMPLGSYDVQVHTTNMGILNLPGGFAVHPASPALSAFTPSVATLSEKNIPFVIDLVGIFSPYLYPSSFQLKNSSNPSYAFNINPTSWPNELQFSGHFSVPGNIPGGNYDLEIMTSDFGLLTLPSALTIDTCFGANCVWPGDANADGLADNTDLLDIGLVFGDNDVENRYLPTENWVGQDGIDWLTNQPSGLNKKHCDSDGDGVITFSDTLAVYQNYGLVHQKFDHTLLATSTDPMLVVDIVNANLQAGDVVEMAVTLGEVSNMATDIYGLAFSLNFNPALIVDGSLQVNYGGSVFGTPGVDMIQLAKQHDGVGRADFALSKINQTNMDVNGVLLHIKMELKQDLSGIDLSNGLQMDFSNITMIDNNATQKPVNFTGDGIAIESTLGVGYKMADVAVRLYPNPVKETLWIESNKTIVGASLFNTMGQKVLDFGTGNDLKNTQIDLSSLERGCYVLKLTTKEGLSVNKAHILE